MVKRILKIVSIVLASCIVVIGGFIGVTALRGGFEEEVINITKLYFGEDDTFVAREIRTLDDVIASINYEPKNATNTKLEVEVLGNENGIISAPETIEAGKDFVLDVKQDSKGNNIGGVVTVKASQGIAEVVMTVIVDVDIPNNALYFTGDDSGKITTSGKSFTMAISDETQYVYLKSNLVNAFFLQANNQNLKNADISYVYNKEDGTVENKNVSAQSSIERRYNAHDNMYNYFYKIPLVTDQAGTLKMTAKMHRTSEIEAVFKESRFENLPKLLRNQNNSSADKEAAVLMLSKYNDFLNKYIKYFDTSAESYSFFKSYVSPLDGRVSLETASQVEGSFEHVFVSATATINVTAIKLENFTSMNTSREYGVTVDSSDEVLFSVSGINANNIVDDFGLNIKTNNDDAIGSDEKKDYMFKSLAVNPYLYLDINMIATEDLDEAQGLITWADRQYKYITVYGFDGNAPITKPTEDSAIVGYLLLLESSDEYISITQLQLNDEKHWRLSCNVPMLKDQSSVISKALYLGFEVSGIGSDVNSMITIQAFTRIYVNYEDLEFNYEDINNIAVNSLDKYMSINTGDIKINDNSEYYDKLATGRYTQDITNNLSNSTIGNLESATYQNVMYFAEKTSNKVDDEYSKIATVGNYNFINYSNANSGNNTTYKFGEEELIGERIATYRMVNNEKRYYIQALNASTIPVKFFAVVYLSDKNGYPIDINGRKIEIDEKDAPDEVRTLVVLRISEIVEDVMPSVFVESYVENINFYTQSNQAVILGKNEDAGESGVAFEEGFISRNHLNYYTDEDGNRVSDDILDDIHDFLSLKLLKNNYFTLYVTNLELDSSGNVAPIAVSVTEIDCKGLNGENLNIGYDINHSSNRQLAFNAMCLDISNYSLHTDSQQVQVYGTPEIISIDADEDGWKPGMNATMIRYILHSSKDDDANTDPKIYLNPENSTIPYSNNLVYSDSTGEQQVAKNNFVIYHTHKLRIDDVQLNNSITMQNKLYARYAKIVDDVQVGDLVFNYDISGEASGQYWLPIENGNVAYSVKNNLISESKVNGEFVDCSQVGTIDNPENAEGTYFFVSIDDYIAYYTKLPNANVITYTTAKNVIEIAEDVHFNNILQEKSTNYINFGTKQYSFVTDGVIGTVDINGYKLEINLLDNDNDIWELTIPKGTIFPLVEGNKALIYNEVFELSSSDYTNYYIKDYVNNDLGISGQSIKVNKSANIMLANGQSVNYDASKYLDDSISAIVKTSSVGQSTASVNFLQGEELGMFVEDVNGSYKKVVDKTNENIYHYVLLDGTESLDITKYSISNLDKDGDKMGVKVYMLVTIPFVYDDVKDTYEYTFYKAIEYELLQEEIEVVGYNSPSSSDVNSNINPLLVDAGKSTNITLGTEPNSGGYISIKANKENYFFEHVTFDITSTNIKGITCEVYSDYIKVTVPDLVTNESFVIQMQYLYKNNETITVKYYVEARANVEFSHVQNVVGIKDISDVEKAYVVKLTSGISNIATDIFKSTNFKLGDNISQVKLKEGNTEYLSTITLEDVEAEYDGTKINYGSKVYTIILVLTNGNEIQVNYKLYVEIVPTYLIDATRVQSNDVITIYNGEDLYGNYIRLYNGNLSVSELANVQNIIPSTNDIYKSIYTIDTDVDLDTDALSKGQIKLKTMPSVDTTIELTLSYESYNGVEKTYNFSVVVRGIDMKYSPTGRVTGSDSDARSLNSNITIEVPMSTTSFDITKYFDFNLSNTEETNEAVRAILIDSNGQAVSMITKFKDGDQYTIAYMKSTSGSGFTLVGSVGYTLTFTVVTG